MKLIDLLVQELPKCGGWPNGAERCAVGEFDGDSITVAFCFPKEYSNGFDVPFQYTVTIPIPGKHVSGATDYCMITRNLYEAALAASQKQTWNGEGLPPVGCECESKQFSQVDWTKFKVVAVCDGHVFGFLGNGVSTALDSKMWEFRPPRTEAKMKRDAAVEAIHWYMPEFIPDTPNKYYHAKKIYDAIAAGKIPGVKLEG